MMHFAEPHEDGKKQCHLLQVPLEERYHLSLTARTLEQPHFDDSTLPTQEYLPLHYPAMRPTTSMV